MLTEILKDLKKHYGALVKISDLLDDDIVTQFLVDDSVGRLHSAISRLEQRKPKGEVVQLSLPYRDTDPGPEVA